MIDLRQPRLAAVIIVFASVASCADRPEPVDALRDTAATQAAAEAPPAAPALRRTPPFSLADREQWRRVLDWPSSCEESFQSTRAAEDGGLAIGELAAGLSIVEVLCAAGSYQLSHTYVRFDERGSSRVATTLQFPVYESADAATLTVAQGTELFGDVTLSLERRELSVLALSRQLADCGIWTRYDVATERPQLVAAASLLPCPSTPGSPAESVAGDAPRGWRPIRLAK